MQAAHGDFADGAFATGRFPWYDLNTAGGMVPQAPTERNATMNATKATRNDAPVTTNEKMEAALAASAAARTEAVKAITADATNTENKAPKAAPKAKAPKAPKAAKKTAKSAKKAPKAKKAAKGNDEDGEDESEDDQPVATIVKPKYKAEYAQHDGTCGDRMASAFSKFCRNDEGELDLAKLAAVKKANGIAAVRWAKLNPGQQRMNASNVLRGMLRRGDDVTVGSEKFKAAKPKAA